MVSKENVIVVTIFTVVGALLINVFSPVFSPMSESIRDSLSGEPNTTSVTATTFDSVKRQVTKNVTSHDTITSNSIRFDFTGDQEPPINDSPLFKVIRVEYSVNYPQNFQCSLDGAPFEDCVSPKSYGELATEVGHTFQVRAIGILGNFDKSPYKFQFTTVTSAFVEGVIAKGNSSREVDAKIKFDHATQPRDTVTDKAGRFEFEGVGQGRHEFIVSSTNSTLGNRTGSFFVPAGEQEVNKDFDINWMSDYANLSGGEGVLDNPKEVNLQYNSSNVTVQANNVTVTLVQESNWSPGGPNPIFTKISLGASENILSEIKNVTYYLHPTFIPSNITIDTQENRFATTFTNWGKFDLGAIVHFKDGKSQRLELPSEQWSEPN